MTSYIKRFVSQQCVGEDWIRNESYYIGEVIMSDGSQQTVYAVNRWERDENGYNVPHQSPWTTEPPPFWKRRPAAPPTPDEEENDDRPAL